MQITLLFVRWRVIYLAAAGILHIRAPPPPLLPEAQTQKSEVIDPCGSRATMRAKIIPG